MRSIKFRVAAILLSISLLTHPASADEETDFQQRASLLINQVADAYVPPGENASPQYNGVPDPEKYVWPKVIARLRKYPGDSWSNSKINQFSTRSPFHFTLVGMARIMPMFPGESAMVSQKQNYLSRVWARTDSYNAWTGEGTENHLNMSRTSGYIYASQSLGNGSFPQASSRQSDMKNWALQWAKRTYEVGTAEWDSSTYTIYNLIGWLNLYDFAPDAEVRSVARAVLDFYAISIALKYTAGVTSGAEMRGGSSISNTMTGTDFLGWLWFGDAPTPAWSGNDYIQSVHAATSSYRPPLISHLLARKALSFHAQYRSSKPSYLRNQASLIRECFYIGPTYTVGTSFSPLGGWTNGDNQVVDWKLTAWNSSGLPLVVTGHGGTRTGAGGLDASRRGVGRNPWDQFVQHRNVIIQMTRVPTDAATQDSTINNLINQWKTQWANDFSARFPGDTRPNPVGKATLSHSIINSYVSFPSSATTTLNNNIRFIQLDRTYLAVFSLRNSFPSSPATAESGRNYVQDSAVAGELCGLVIEIGNATDHGTFSNFMNLILAKNGLNKSQLANRRVIYTALNNDVIDATYQTSGSWTEPDFDWDYGARTPMITPTSPPFIQPSWPTGAGQGRVATWSVNGSPVDLASAWPLYEGPNLSLTGSVLRLDNGTTVYEVDYRGSLPVFRTYPIGSSNQPPQASMTSPANGSTFQEPASISLQAATSDPDGTISQVEFYSGSTLITVDNTSPFVFSWNNVMAGTHGLRAVAQDNQGATGTSSAVHVIVNPQSGNIPSPWLNTDINNPGIAGSSSYSSGVFTVKGSGADIWGTSDQFQFLYQQLAGDGEIIARITGLQSSDSWAKAGVMIREGLFANTRHAFMALTGGNGLAFQHRINVGDGSFHVSGGAGSAPVWVRIKRSGDLFTAYRSSDGSTWIEVGSVTLTMNIDVHIGLAVTAHSNSSLATAVFDNVSVVKGGGSGAELPAPWQAGDVGSPQLAGKAGYSQGVFTVEGAGGDIWGTSDQFHYVHQRIWGNCEVTVRIASQQNTDPWAKAGVMMRETLNANSKFAMLAMTPQNGTVFQYRDTTGGGANSTAGNTITTPHWLRLQRQGDTFRSLRSTDGTNWIEVGSFTIPMVAEIYVGIGVTSHNPGVLCMATFDQVQARTGVSDEKPTITWNNADINNPGIAGSGTQSAGAFRVSGSGADIWGTSDQFHFMYATLSGDGEISGKFTGMQNTDPWAKAGFMIRESLMPQSRHVMLAATPSNGLAFQHRLETGSATSHQPGGSAAAGTWIRLVRTGNVVAASRSADGISWSPVGSVTTSTAGEIFIGICVASHNPSALCTSTFEQVTVVP